MLDFPDILKIAQLLFLGRSKETNRLPISFFFVMPVRILRVGTVGFAGPNVANNRIAIDREAGSCNSG